MTDVKRSRHRITGGFLGNVDMMREVRRLREPAGQCAVRRRGHRHGAGRGQPAVHAMGHRGQQFTGSNQRPTACTTARAPRSPSASTVRCW
ncbi:MAG: hypothetical protein ACLT98_03405 [Eggerthellaceae bacterium]